MWRISANCGWSPISGSSHLNDRLPLKLAGRPKLGTRPKPTLGSGPEGYAPVTRRSVANAVNGTFIVSIGRQATPSAQSLVFVADLRHAIILTEAHLLGMRPVPGCFPFHDDEEVRFPLLPETCGSGEYREYWLAS